MKITGKQILYRVWQKNRAKGEKVDITQKDVKNIIESYQEEIKNALLENKKVMIHNFATYSPKQVKGRLGRNPATNERMQIDGFKSVKFKPSKTFKKELNKK